MSMQYYQRTPIGLDRTIKLEWLNKVSNYVLAGIDKLKIKEMLRADLIGSFRSNNVYVRGSIDKTITIIMKVWCSPPDKLRVFHKDGLKLIARIDPINRIAIHWGLILATYPFWGGVASSVGRLIRLQGRASISHVQRRIREIYGERETVSRRCRYIVRSFLDWGVISEDIEKGVYKLGSHFAIDDPELESWLIEASLRAKGLKSYNLNGLIEGNEIFPFKLKLISPEKLMSFSSRLEIQNLDINQTTVFLKEK